MKTIRLRHGAAVAEIALLGAELRSWSVGVNALIWTSLPHVWADTAPILFPIVGWTRGAGMHIDGVRYPLGLHGFARTMLFRVDEQGADHAVFVLEDTPESRAVYPFAFSFAVTYRLGDATLGVTVSVRNRGAGRMPYACGLHPGFRWPFAGGELEDYAIVFERDEEPSVPIITAGGLFTRERRAIPLTHDRLDLSAALFAREALCVLDARSRRLRFVHAAGAAITIKLEGFPHIALWSKPNGCFLSIEAWTGHGDHDDSDGDFMSKPSMIHLSPGQSREHTAIYGFESNDRPSDG